MNEHRVEAPSGAIRPRAASLDFAPALAFVFISGWGPALINIVGRAGFDPYTQNFYRYLGALVLFLPFAALVDGRALRRALRIWPAFLAPAAAIATFQTTWVMGLYRTTPTVGAFSAHSSVVYGILGGALFFADERRLVLSWRFLAGVVVVAGGFVGVVAGRPDTGEGGPMLQAGFGTGVLLLCLGAFCWGAYGLLVKRIMATSRAGTPCSAPCPAASPEEGRPVGPLHAFAVTMLFADGILLVVALSLGDLAHVARASRGAVLLVFGSGAVCVGVAQSLYFLSIRRIGVATTHVVGLMMPFLAGLFSLLLIGERVSAVQWASGAVLVAGVAWLVVSRPASP